MQRLNAVSPGCAAHGFYRRALRRRLIRLIVADITRDVLRRRRLGWRA